MKQYVCDSNKESRKLKLNIKNIIIYMLILLGCVFMNIYVNGYMFMYMLVVISALAICSITAMIIMNKYIKITMSITDTEIEKDGLVNVGLILKNKSYIPSPSIKIYMNVGNEFYGSNKEVEVRMPIIPKNKSKVAMPLRFDMCGMTVVRIKRVCINDIFSLVSYVYTCNLEEHICIIPKKEELSDVQMGSYVEGLTQNEENNLKGSDFSDVSNIREYVPGDRIKDIHWKATAKKDELMVKERVRLSENQLAVLVDVSGENDSIERVLELSFNMVRHALSDGVPVSLMWWNDGASILEERDIINKRQINKNLIFN
jgi:uncharacterized protein (DUF58 family)